MGFEADSVIEVQFHYNVNGQQCMNVWHYEEGVNYPGTVWDAEKAVADRMVANLIQVGTMPKAFADLLSQDTFIKRVQCQQIFPLRYRAYYADCNVPGSWTTAAPCNAQNVQSSLQKFGIGGTRHDIGAMHIGGIPEDALLEGYLTNAYLAKLQAFADAWKVSYAFDAGSGATIIPGIVKKKKVVVDGKDYYQVDGLTQLFGVDIKDEVRTMQRRTVGRGI